MEIEQNKERNVISLYLDAMQLLQKIKDKQKQLVVNYSYDLFREVQRLNNEFYTLSRLIGHFNADCNIKLQFMQSKKNKLDITGDFIGHFFIIRRITREEEKKIEALNVPWEKIKTQFIRREKENKGEEERKEEKEKKHMRRKDGRSTYNPKTRSSRWEVLNLRTGETSIKTKQVLKQFYDTSKSLIGFTSGILTVVNGPTAVKGKRMWLCKCKCGRKVFKTDLAIRTKSAKRCCRWCRLSPNARRQAKIIFERQMKQTCMKDPYFVKEYRRLQGRPSLQDKYLDTILNQKTMELLNKEFIK